MYHGVSIADSALVAASMLSDRYISERFLPDKAVSLIATHVTHRYILMHAVAYHHPPAPTITHSHPPSPNTSHLP